MPIHYEPQDDHLLVITIDRPERKNALDLTQRLRDDLVSEVDLHARYQEIAPAVEDGLYLVPRVIE
mgnify:CR=1 FL=1